MTVKMYAPSQHGFGDSGSTSKAENDTPRTINFSSAQYKMFSTGGTDGPMSWAALPKPVIPPREEFQPIEKFVSDAIDSRHTILPPLTHISGGVVSSPSKSSPAVAGYRAVLDLLRKKDDLPMLCKVFLALRTKGIEKMSSERSKHNRMIHYIFRLNPFDTRDRSSEVVQNHSLGIAYLNFIVALTSANSVFLTPTLNSLWRLIVATDAVTPEDKELYLSKATQSKAINSFEKEDNPEVEQPDIASDTEVEYRLQANSLLHGALRKVIQLVPKGSTEIYPVIASSFPFKLSPLNYQVNYIKQCMIVLKYVPTMHRQLLELCVDKCLEIDVEIRIAKNGAVKIEEQTKGDDDDDNNSNNRQLDEEEVKQKNKLKEECLEKLKNQTDEEKVDEMADKLDTLMYLLFEHIGTMTKSKEKTARQLFNMLMPTFDSVILTTHRCKFVQFIIMFLCGLEMGGETNDNFDPVDNGIQLQLSREFAAKLIDIVLDPYRATITRQSAACYLASFASRATCVCPETACESVSALLRFAEAYMDAFPTEAATRNARRYLGADSNDEQANNTVSVHSLFYTICQASFYIMCFRGKECIEYFQKAEEYHKNQETNKDPEMLEYSKPELVDVTIKRWNRLCAHYLNPLKFCLESVRGEFLLLASHFELLEDSLLQKMIIQDRKLASNTHLSDTNSSPGRLKKRRRVSTSIQTAATLERRRLAGGVGGLGKGSNPLDSFFPFDPYLLRRSYDFIEPYYRHWNGGCAFGDESDDSSANHDDYYDVSSVGGDESVSQDSSFLSDDEEDENNEEEVTEEGKGLTAMSLTSTIVSMGGSEWTDDLSDHGNCFDHETKDTGDWVNELKRARAASIDDCW